ncbi:unnamed protein product [Nyctereutes procyonoides]|uniref:(raccoon dog) hypothetical protein n=1 Tax=Nyctereutes procyonoides TaxID=34880 RepID=A0A811YP09_NYCPR|nr:unnamed protein product [Nyctereutes procyonoides]
MAKGVGLVRTSLIAKGRGRLAGGSYRHVCRYHSLLLTGQSLAWPLRPHYYLLHLCTHTKREAETKAEGEAGSMPGARHGTRSQDSRIAPWAKGRHQTAEPPRDPQRLID